MSDVAQRQQRSVVTRAGVTMPRFLYGTAWKKEATAALVAQALAAGFRGIDTACQPKHYDEPGVGAGIKAALGPALSRADLYLQTKFTPLSGQDLQRLPYDPGASAADQVAQSFAASQVNLSSAVVDGLVLHSPVEGARGAEVWRALERIVDAGGARQLGISNCYDLAYLQAHWASVRVKPAVVQNRFYADSGYDVALRAWCRQQGIVYQSFWTLTANPHLLAAPALAAIAAAQRRTPAQVLFRYLLQREVVPLTGSRSRAHLIEDLAVFDFELAEPEAAAIDRLLEP